MCGALMTEISVLIKEIPKSSLVPSTMWGYNKKSMTQKKGAHPAMLAPWSQSSSSKGNKFPLLEAIQSVLSC